MSFLDLIFPQNCLECGKEGYNICLSCIQKVPQVGWNTPYNYAIWKYVGVVRKAILATKYKLSLDIAQELAILASKNIYFSSFDPKNTILIPVPLHWRKKNLRGFNQAEELGEIISESLGWQFMSDLIIKRHPTKSQVELKGEKRRQNLRDAFSLGEVFNEKDFRDKAVIIFDDVYTTGSTVKEIVSLLRRSGVFNVSSLTIAA